MIFVFQFYQQGAKRALSLMDVQSLFCSAFLFSNDQVYVEIKKN